ncbi:MAG: HDOD domain-containing protein [Candidatus Hydrogenedentes bacterium]|nr:HDOD domain-containing protein [Candidatus Hydrogenedentota bacterium]
MPPKALNLEYTIQKIQELPTLPSVLGKILATAADPDASAIDLGQHIAADQTLSATILKLVNSPYYGFYRQIRTVTQAIVVLGFLEVRNLTLAATAFKALRTPGNSHYRSALWRHALGTAFAAEMCAKHLDYDLEGTFEAGLLHDIGKVALDVLFHDAFIAAYNAAAAGEASSCAAEETEFGFNHTQVGGVLAEHWHLPESVVEAIRCHHAPQSATIDPSLTQLIALANEIAYAAQLGERETGSGAGMLQAMARNTGLTGEQLATVVDALVKERDRIDELLGMLASD